MYHMTHNRKRIRKLSTAVFRGSRTQYNFDVYPITTAITDNPAVFIFSRRKADKHGRWHHAVSCVGETPSIVKEIKRHKRAKCVKGNEANVVCLFREEDRSTRSGVLDDIVSARSFSCVQGKFKPTIKAKLDAVKNPKTGKVLPFKPLAAGTGLSISRSVRTKRKAKPAAETISQKVIRKIVKKAKPAAGGKRVQSGVDSDGGQHRLSKPKKSLARSAKARVAGDSGSRTKFAA
jgi:hypothetical protein